MKGCDYMPTGSKIKEIRIKKGLTQKQLGEKCGMYESQIRKYENGNANPKIETLQKIADALETPITEFTDMPLIDNMTLGQYVQTKDFKMYMHRKSEIDNFVQSEQFKKLFPHKNMHDAILTILREIYGTVEQQLISGTLGGAVYYVVKSQNNSFILKNEDIKNISDYICTSMTNGIKDTRSEEDIKKELITNLSDPEYIKKRKQQK